jgi:hypothetical protein
MADVKRVLIVGDSFMKPDSDYPGQHFSEMLGAVDTVIMSQDGASMSMIVDQTLRGLELDIDCAVLGFTSPHRLEYPNKKSPGSYVPSGAIGALSEDQERLDLLWQTQCDDYMNCIKAHAQATGLMSMLSYRKIPFVWTPNLMYYNVRMQRYDRFKNLLAPFSDRKIGSDFMIDVRWVERPTYHVDDPVKQNQLAQECRCLLGLEG